LGETSFKLKYSMIRNNVQRSSIAYMHFFTLQFNNNAQHIFYHKLKVTFSFSKKKKKTTNHFYLLFWLFNSLNYFATAENKLPHIPSNNKNQKNCCYEQLHDLCFLWQATVQKTCRAFVKLFLPMIDNNNQYIHYINTYIHI